MNLMNLGRVLRVSWVRVGEGCVDWTGSTTSHETSLARGCDLGIPVRRTCGGYHVAVVTRDGLL